MLLQTTDAVKGKPRAISTRQGGGVRVFKRSGAKILVLSGGGSPWGTETEAVVMKNLACELGVEQGRIVTEQESYNTMEQAVLLAKLLSGKKDRRIGLVTSALHMLRSEKTFRSRFPEDTIVPVPVNYLYKPPRRHVKSIIPSVKALSESTCAVHEWIGLVWYSIRY
ncbi:MAG TPA: YdcF family protein [Phycisphaerales bacterium]|nr:YdcF family protein [Phycisphaerales bacterium]